MTTEGQQTNDDAEATTPHFRLGNTFSYPDGKEFTALLSFKQAGGLVPFCGKWDSSLGGLRDQRGIALEQLAILYCCPKEVKLALLSRSSRAVYYAKQRAEAAAAEAVEKGEEEGGEEEEQQQQQQQQTTMRRRRRRGGRRRRKMMTMRALERTRTMEGMGRKKE
jgi:hypothetical protein